MFIRIDHVALHVSDIGRSIGFYERHFGFKKYFQHRATGGHQIAYLKLGDTVMELTHRSDGPMAAAPPPVESGGLVGSCPGGGVPLQRLAPVHRKSLRGSPHKRL